MNEVRRVFGIKNLAIWQKKGLFVPQNRILAPKSKKKAKKSTFF